MRKLFRRRKRPLFVAEEVAATVVRNSRRRYLFTDGSEERVRAAARALPADMTAEQMIHSIARIVQAEGRRPECYVPLALDEAMEWSHA